MTPKNSTIDKISSRLTIPSDIENIIKMERDADNVPFIRQWSADKHYAAIGDANIAHLVIETSNEKRIIGYAILIGLENQDKSVEFKRLVINEKGKGYGRKAMRMIKKYAFENLKVHRLWLEVLENNSRAFQLYKSEGFIIEGTHRESMRQGEKFLSLIVMSQLSHEYETSLYEDIQ